MEGVAELSGQFAGGCGGSGRAQWSVCRWMWREWQSSVVSLQVDVSVTELNGQFVGGCGGSGRAQWSVCRWMWREWQSSVVSL